MLMYLHGLAKPQRPDGMNILRIAFCCAVLMGFFATLADAEEALVFTSAPARVTLLELYSSEGCSSCPLADAWVNSLQAGPGLWTQLVPVVFHVDYWDYIGWKDRFATPAFTDRQR